MNMILSNPSFSIGIGDNHSLVVQSTYFHNFQYTGSFTIQLGKGPELPHDKLTWLEVISDYGVGPCLKLRISGPLLIGLYALSSKLIQV